MSATRNHAPVQGRSMGNYRGEGNSNGNSHGYGGPSGSLTGRRVLIRPDAQHPRAALTATLMGRYCREGAYYARLDVLPIETVVRPNDVELLPV